MSKPLNKDDVIQHKKSAIKKINRMMEKFINDSSEKHLKKADLLSYWFESFANYIINEETYDPRKQIRYKRGDVIKANFGFNVGKEYGGLHYAIVIDNHNDRNAHVITVIPLTSGTESDTHSKDVYMGTELFNKLKDKYDTLINQNNQKLQEVQTLASTISSTHELITLLLEDEIKKNNGDMNAKVSSDLQEKILIFQKSKQDYENNMHELEKNKEILLNSKKEIDHLKSGSIALIGQITTIDKARIYIPRKSCDALYGINFSKEKMNLVNEAIKKQYIYE